MEAMTASSADPQLIARLDEVLGRIDAAAARAGRAGAEITLLRATKAGAPAQTGGGARGGAGRRGRAGGGRGGVLGAAAAGPAHGVVRLISPANRVSAG